ncbi:hypothetical protein [Bremerella alba]|uniref:Uncharacterized protein n=1 Tax=Bremerella alba TaxID=980252 RepID=A0A7V8V5P7_9BACT|nr:hypothetical protein [Bremerella alba]MBA2115439.1 hypothetical protein [Bremerella alba]
MMWFLTCVVLLAPAGTEAKQETPETIVVVVVGEPGDDKYQELFTQWAERWKTATEQTTARLVTIGLDESGSSDPPDRLFLEETLAALIKEPPQTLWLVLIGHGTFDGKKAKFNLRGPDISAEELSELLSPISCRMAIINCASASGPFIHPLSGRDRIIVTATQSGYEYNFARFGDFLSQTIGDSSGDLDKDGQTSLLEAWIAASKQTQNYYDSQSQLATEHALLDDNGDRKGTPADWFRGIYVTKSSKDNSIPDGTLANQFILVPDQGRPIFPQELLAERNQLEHKLAQLRQQKLELGDEEYLSQLQAILVPLAKLYQAVEPSPGKDAEAESSEASP